MMDDEQTPPEFDSAAVWSKIEQGMQQMQLPPPCVMGALYIGKMVLRFDVSGATVVTFSDGTECVMMSDRNDPTLYLCAEGLGYGRQVGALTRDRVLMHCMLADYLYSSEPWYMMGAAQWPNVGRVDFLLVLLNRIPCDVQPLGEDLDVVRMAAWLLRGTGSHYNA